jgi:triacylglycerol lipase
MTRRAPQRPSLHDEEARCDSQRRRLLRLRAGVRRPRHINFLSGAGKVDDVVGLAPSNHGTDNAGAIVAGATFGPACDQQRAGSAFLRNLNAGDETPGDVSYTAIETRYDEVVTPYPSAFLAPGPRTANILLQDACPAEVIDHHEMPNDGPRHDVRLRLVEREPMDEPRGPVGPRGSTCSFVLSRRRS